MCHKAHTNSDACPLISISRLLQIIGLFCNRDLYHRSLLQKRPNSDAGPLIWSPQAAVRSHNGMRLCVLGGLFRNACRNNPPKYTHNTSIAPHTPMLRCVSAILGGFAQSDRSNNRSLLQKSPTKEMLFCKRLLICRAARAYGALRLGLVGSIK